MTYPGELPGYGYACAHGWTTTRAAARARLTPVLPTRMPRGAMRGRQHHVHACLPLAVGTAMASTPHPRYRPLLAVMASRPYNDPAHRAAVAAIKRAPTPCWMCGRPATTIDHVPPLALHTHTRGTSCCEHRPACGRCNYGAGRAIALRARGGTSTRRTWSRRW